MKHYRYRKIKPEDVEVMKELREQGLSYKKIGKRFNVSWKTPHYHLNPREKEIGRKRAYKSSSKLTKKQKKKRQLKEQKYRSEYMKDRYQNDEKFREDFLDIVKRNFEKRRKGWLIAELCSNCGREREDKKWRMCKRCRRKKREYEFKKGIIKNPRKIEYELE